MNLHRRSSIPSERDLAAFADGTLTADRRRRVAQALEASPELQADIDAQRRVLAAIDAVGGEGAPAALRAQLELARPPRHARVPGPRFPGARMRLPGAATAALFASGAAAVIAAVVLALSGGANAPTVAEASTLSARPAQQGAPATTGQALDVSEAGIQFPAWRASFGYWATGVRSDRFDDRTATTVYYSGAGGQEVAYTIVSGAPLALGTNAASTSWRDGIVLRSFTRAGRLIVTWQRDGHTCVLASTATSLPTLLRLASWAPAPVRY